MGNNYQFRKSFVDRSISTEGRPKERTSRIDMGVDIAHRVYRRKFIGRPMSCYWIAKFAGCSTTAIQSVERKVLKKLRIRITPSEYKEIRELLQECKHGTEHAVLPMKV